MVQTKYDQKVECCRTILVAELVEIWYITNVLKIKAMQDTLERGVA